MVTRTFSELVRDLKQRREVGDQPPVVLLGAGASIESGIGAMTDLFVFVQCANFDEFVRYIDPMTPPEWRASGIALPSSAQTSAPSK
jgi:hypothetical protein